MKVMIAFAIFGACHKTPAVTPPPPHATDASTEPTPEARARSIVAAQIDASELPDEGERETALRATLTDDAVVGATGGTFPVSALDAQMFDHQEIATLVADGNADVIWFSTTFTDHRSADDTSQRPVRYTGVAARSAQWKIVAASVETDYRAVRGSGKVGNTNPMPNGTEATSLSAMFLDGAKLAGAATPSLFVLGPGEGDHARGPDALGPWRTRTLTADPDVREVVGPTWATFQAAVAFPGGNLAILGVAIGSRARWTPILIQYVGR